MRAPIAAEPAPIIQEERRAPRKRAAYAPAYALPFSTYALFTLRCGFHLCARWGVQICAAYAPAYALRGAA